MFLAIFELCFICFFGISLRLGWCVCEESNVFLPKMIILPHQLYKTYHRFPPLIDYEERWRDGGREGKGGRMKGKSEGRREGRQGWREGGKNYFLDQGNLVGCFPT